MSRSLIKGPYVAEYIMKKVQQKLGLGLGDPLRYKPIRLWARSSVILPPMIGLTFEIHNGKTFQKLLVQENMVGHKFGEFALTRKYPKHPAKKR